ncbi:hypothetical protein ACTFIV_006813 [Dictyostelium citrinum]
MSKRNSGADPPNLNESGEGDGCSENNQRKCSNQPPKPTNSNYSYFNSGSAPPNVHYDQQQSPFEEIRNLKIKSEIKLECETLLETKESDSDETQSSTSQNTQTTTNEEENNKARPFWYSVPHNPPPQPRPPPTITSYSITTKTISTIETQTGIETVELITTTTEIKTTQPHTIPISSQNRIENYKFFLTNDIYEDLKKLWKFFKDNKHFNKGRDKDFMENLKDFKEKFNRYNLNQQDLGISDCETTLTFCKNLKVESAAFNINLDKLKNNLIYIRFIISNNPQPIGNP